MFYRAECRSLPSVLLQINYFLSFDDFQNSPIPNDIIEYKLYRKNMIEFINKRNQRIKNYMNKI